MKKIVLFHDTLKDVVRSIVTGASMLKTVGKLDPHSDDVNAYIDDQMRWIETMDLFHLAKTDPRALDLIQDDIDKLK